MFLQHKHKDYNYFKALSSMGENARDAAFLLRQVLSDFHPGDLPRHLENLHRLENLADYRKHEISDQLIHEFLPPMDSGDLAALSRGLDQIINRTEHVLLEVQASRIPTIRPESGKLTALLADAGKILPELLRLLPDFKKAEPLRKIPIQLHTLENDGRRLHHHAIGRLYGDPSLSSPALVGWTRILDAQLAALTACADFADQIEDVILKNT